MGRKEEAYTFLKDAILNNKMAPNTPIVEMTIAEELKMSRTPIREAMRQLESEGLLVNYQSRGSFVAAFSPYDVEEIYDLRVLIEVWALERSFMRITSEELDDLEQRFIMGYQQADWSKLHEADRDLHDIIMKKAGSKRMLDFMNMLYMQIERIRRMSARDPKRSERSYQEHMAIIKNIREKDIQKSRQLLTAHLRSVADSAIEMSKSGI